MKPPERVQNDWRKICEAAGKEPETEKLLDLIAELIEALDARQKNTAPILDS